MSGREVVVRVADLRCGMGNDTLITVGLGSCVAILLYDAEARIGGMAHILLPSPALSRKDSNPAKFPQTAVPRLLELMGADGAKPQRITARLAGGASMFAALAPPGTIQMGERNLVAARQVLNTHRLPLVGEAVGGDFGRTVRFHLCDGRVQISTVAHGVQNL
ncbi:MAG TPA: chemotaxis protein CheD [Gemmatimonadales bacterium]|jgi:chemotaxis protein CheD|nr:chemotaxis protein CheD [Gemmatimonadales bacterium]